MLTGYTAHSESNDSGIALGASEHASLAHGVGMLTRREGGVWMNVEETIGRLELCMDPGFVRVHLASNGVAEVVQILKCASTTPESMH